MPQFLTSAEAAIQLGVPYWYLSQLLRERVIPEPARHGTRFLWTVADLDRARAVIEQRRARRQRIESTAS